MTASCPNPDCRIEVPESYVKMCVERGIQFSCPICKTNVPLQNRLVPAIAGQTLKDWARADRLSLALVFTDVVGFTQLVRHKGDDVMQPVIEAHFAKARELIETYRGAFGNDTGDGVLAVFHDIGPAVDFATSLRLNPGHELIRIRSSIHIGAVAIKGNRLFGREVNFASRLLTAIGQKGEVWLSSRAKEDLDCLRAERHQNLNWISRNCKLKDFGRVMVWTLVDA